MYVFTVFISDHLLFSAELPLGVKFLRWISIALNGRQISNTKTNQLDLLALSIKCYFSYLEVMFKCLHMPQWSHKQPRPLSLIPMQIKMCVWLQQVWGWKWNKIKKEDVVDAPKKIKLTLTIQKNILGVVGQIKAFHIAKEVIISKIELTLPWNKTPHRFTALWGQWMTTAQEPPIMC